MIIGQTVTEKGYALKNKIAYIIEATLEYFITILIGTTYLATVLQSVGASDSLVGIISSSVLTLACCSQLFACFIVKRKHIKRIVIICELLNQLVFALFFLIPSFQMKALVKIYCLISIILFGKLLANLINPIKINWLMSLIEDKKRGVFTANKEIVSLIGGTLFSLLMSSILDRYKSAGNLNTAFIIFAIAIFIMAVIHMFSLVIASSPKENNSNKDGIFRELKRVVGNKDIIKIMLISVIWSIASYFSTPFFPTYELNELGFSNFYASGVLLAIYSVIRISASVPLGKYADKTSFCKMEMICFCVAGASFLLNTFTVPGNGKVMFTIYYAMHAFSLAGINSCIINLIFDYVETENRAVILGFQSAIAGICGFCSTLAGSALLTYIQQNGNRFLGMHVYAQQVLSFVSFLITSVLLIYIRLCVVKKIKPLKQKSEEEKKD